MGLACGISLPDFVELGAGEQGAVEVSLLRQARTVGGVLVGVEYGLAGLRGQATAMLPVTVLKFLSHYHPGKNLSWVPAASRQEQIRLNPRVVPSVAYLARLLTGQLW
jgi:hypothetical protein